MALFGKKKDDKLEQQVSDLENLQAETAGIAEELSVAKRNIEIQKAKDEAILKSIGEGIIATDEKGIIIKLSESAPALLGTTTEALLGKVYSEVIKIEDEKGQPINAEDLNTTKAVSTKAMVESYQYFKRADGRKFVAHSAASPIVFGGEPIGAIEVFRDETKEKEVDRMKTEFVSLASHQLKAPLTAINGYTSMLLEEEVGQLNPQQKEFLHYVEKSATNMVALISDFLNVTKLEAGHIIVEPEPTDLKKFLQGLIDEVKPVADAKKCKIQYVADDEFLQVPVDPKLFSQVAHNLLTNAIKYSKTSPDGEVKVQLRKSEDGKELILSVSDNGIGIPKGEQDKIFARLYRASNAVQSQSEGTGLGLYLAKQIAESAGGRIWFESEENKGTQFHAAIPASGMKRVLK